MCVFSRHLASRTQLGSGVTMILLRLPEEHQNTGILFRINCSVSPVKEVSALNANDSIPIKLSVIDFITT